MRAIFTKTICAAAAILAAAGLVFSAMADAAGEWRLDLGESEQLEMVWIAQLGLWMGRYEITNGQYRRYDAAHAPLPHYGHALNGRRQPAVQISWEDAINYAAWLNRNYAQQIPAGFVFRLPTDQEWRFCATGGKAARYVWGQFWPPPNTCNFRGEEGMTWLYRLFESGSYIRGHNDGYIVAAPVEKSGRNTFGVYGMAGNVWEWCADQPSDQPEMCVLRGGGWNNYEEDFLRASHRAYARPKQKNAMIGFRLVLAPEKQR